MANFQTVGNKQLQMTKVETAARWKQRQEDEVKTVSDVSVSIRKNDVTCMQFGRSRSWTWAHVSFVCVILLAHFYCIERLSSRLMLAKCSEVTIRISVWHGPEGQLCRWWIPEQAWCADNGIWVGFWTCFKWVQVCMNFGILVPALKSSWSMFSLHSEGALMFSTRSVNRLRFWIKMHWKHEHFELFVPLLPKKCSNVRNVRNVHFGARAHFEHSRAPSSCRA